MPRDKTQSHNRIIEAAKNEFLTYGYTDASLRRIASNAGIQVSGLYKHFSNKEEMFASLVEPVVDGFMNRFHQLENKFFEDIDKQDIHEQWDNENEIPYIMEYIYDYFDEFKLLVCKSQGTRYERFTHEVARMEESVTLRYMEELKKRDYAVKILNQKEFHLLVTSNVEAVFQTVVHDFTREEAMHYAKTLAHIVPEFTANILLPMVMFLYLLIMDWRLGLGNLVGAFIGVIFASVMMWKSRGGYELTVEKTKKLKDTAVEYINGIEVIKAFGKTGSSYEKFVVAAREGADCLCLGSSAFARYYPFG